MEDLNEDKLAEIVIDFNELRVEQVSESMLATFGVWTKSILKAMFGEIKIPVSVRGNRRELAAFGNAIGREKIYIDAARKYGLDNPRTYKNKAKLTKAIKDFERKTGLKWPVK